MVARNLERARHKRLFVLPCCVLCTVTSRLVCSPLLGSSGNPARSCGALLSGAEKRLKLLLLCFLFAEEHLRQKVSAVLSCARALLVLLPVSCLLALTWLCLGAFCARSFSMDLCLLFVSCVRVRKAHQKGCECQSKLPALLLACLRAELSLSSCCLLCSSFGCLCCSVPSAETDESHTKNQETKEKRG